MDSPDQRLLEEDFASAEFRAGAEAGRWGRLLLPEGLSWPKFIIWIAAAARPGAPERFHFLLDGAGYRVASPTGTLWDPEAKAVLENTKRPKGTSDSRFAKVFRTDWNNGTAFYHPYDRVASSSHTEWVTQQPHQVWTPQHTIADFAAEFHRMLQSNAYVGV